MIEWYRTTIEETGRDGALWMLLAFVVTFAITRAVTRAIRRGARGPLGNVTVGGVHVHHQVFGIVMILSSAMIEFTARPDTPWDDVLAAVFGAGAALTLDEFALWLHLEDVYWEEEGRQSIDAVVVAAGIATLLLLGVLPFDLNDSGDSSRLVVGIGIGISAVLSLVAAFKGKIVLALFGVFVAPVATMAAIRLAKPTSPWARRFYAGRSRKLARAEERHARVGARWNRVRDVIGGAPGR